MPQAELTVARPMPEEPGILAFLELCDSFYPADAVDASIGQQRLWYDALCAAQRLFRRQDVERLAANAKPAPGVRPRLQRGREGPS